MMSARSDVQAQLDRYSFGAALAPLNLRLVAWGETKRGGLVQFNVVGTVPCAIENTPYEATRGSATRHGATTDELHYDVTRALLDWLTHELGEGLRFDNKILADPHVSSPRRHSSSTAPDPDR